MMVLWSTAALAVLVTGLVFAQRSELRLASAARGQVQAQAQGQAAVLLAVQQQVGVATPVDRLQRRAVHTADRVVEVTVMPLNGLIDLNTAPPSLLRDLLMVAGGLDEGVATALAAAIVERRQATAGGRTRRLDAPEELLALPGFDLDLLARIADLVTTGAAGSGKVNPLCAPLEVLRVLARGNTVYAQRVAADRDAGAVTMDTTQFEAAHVDATVNNRYRFTAHVVQPDGRVVAVSRDIDARAAGEPGGPPWRVLRAATWRLGNNAPSPAGQPVRMAGG